MAQLSELAATLSGASRRRTHGADVVTTIVPAVQASSLSCSHGTRAPPASCSIRGPGAVLALASVPSYDPNDFDAEFPTLSNDPRRPLLDRALDGLYPPGSTFKIFTAVRGAR